MKLTHSLPLLVLLASTTSGCEFGEELGQGIACAFDFPSYSTIDSDEEVLRAEVECTQFSDCADSRNLHQDARIDFAIELREEDIEGDLVIRSEPKGFLRVEGFDTDPQECESGYVVSGTVIFDTPGQGAFVVLSNDVEIDRFTVNVQAPESLDIQTSEGGSWHTIEAGGELDLSEDALLRAVVRGPTSDRLIGGPGVEWSSSDPSVAHFTEEAAQSDGPIASLFAGESGQATLRARVGGFEQTVTVSVGPPPAMGGASP